MFYDVFMRLCESKGVPLSKTLSDLGISWSSLYRWREGAEPQLATKRKIADYFGVPFGDLTDGTASFKSSDPELDQLLESLKNDPQRRMMFHLLDGATADEVRAAVEIVDVLMRKLRR